MRRYLWPICCACLCLVASHARAEDPPGGYVAASPEPTAAETLMLEYMNRARANPHGDIPLCLDHNRIPDNVDREMFATEMQGFPASPPIFFDLDLLKAARWHSYYMGFNEMDHDEIEGAVGFTAVGAHARMRLAGYSGGGTGENIIKYGRNPWYQHVAFMVDWGEGPGGMQPGRGHRANIMSSAYRVVGIGAVEHPDGDDVAVTADFGGGRQRYAGGVIYRDEDNDQFYDTDEGVAGVPMGQGETVVRSWGSGAYTLPISNEEGWVRFRIGNAVFARYVRASGDNVKIDIILNDRSQFVSGSAILGELEDLDEDDTYRQLIEMDWQMRTAFIESNDNECDQIMDLVKDIRGQVKADQELLLWAVGNAEIGEVQELCKEKSKRYEGTYLATWFTDAEMCARMRATYVEAAFLLDDGHQLGAVAMSRKLRVMERQFSSLSTEAWLPLGQQIGEAFVALSESGHIDGILTSEASLEGGAELAGGGGFEPLPEPAGSGGFGSRPLTLSAPLEEPGGGAPRDDTEYEASPFSLDDPEEDE